MRDWSKQRLFVLGSEGVSEAAWRMMMMKDDDDDDDDGHVHGFNTAISRAMAVIGIGTHMRCESCCDMHITETEPVRQSVCRSRATTLAPMPGTLL